MVPSEKESLLILLRGPKCPFDTFLLGVSSCMVSPNTRGPRCSSLEVLSISSKKVTL